jgi:leucyl-tRNA synthetase
VAVPEADLPVVLPRVEDFKPDDSGVSPLARVEEWYRIECPQCGAPARRETDVSDTFLDSSWYFLRYPSTDRDDVAFDGELMSRWLPVDCYIGGNEHAVLHLLYARFVTMALHDLGHLEFEEPFTRFRAHGMIIREGAKMSKSRGNVIIPDDIIEQYGADTFRTYLMFLGPYEEGGDYQDEGVQGPHGFLHRLHETVATVVEHDVGPGSDGDSGGGAAADPDVERKLHQTIRQVARQMPDLGFNTSIAAMMEYLNAVRAGGRTATRGEVEPLVVMIAPFAPHLAEELWERLGHDAGIFEGANWPTFDEAKTRETSVKLAVQVNGKLRATVEGPAGMDQDAAETAARSDENVARYLDSGTLKRVIYVPNRLLNFVVEQA